ncbi:glycosyltransferase [Ilumatobacter nonamiensis]|uniref:glycosyltransferase n=1 Tax=Ilumatobacter nonamiensis TaxID=467093 RepID=UPI00034941E3|nr:glycosyltransferase [Ilumatobacter nonamiensis]
MLPSCRPISTASLDAPVAPINRVVVVVPARDEEDTIVDCLDSIRAARRRLSADVSCTIVVVADRCTDRTIARALDALRGDDGDVVLDSQMGTAGAARQLGTECALVDSETDLEGVWIANTDADTCVSPDWLTVQVDLATTGIVGVAGIVELKRDPWGNLALVDSFNRSYSHGDGVNHPHVHGANLGFRADAFRTAGGWNPLATGEDHDLWERLREVGSVLATTALKVTTSARTVGRAPAGFAADLAVLDSALDEPVA